MYINKTSLKSNLSLQEFFDYTRKKLDTTSTLASVFTYMLTQPD